LLTRFSIGPPALVTEFPERHAVPPSSATIAALHLVGVGGDRW
jgi:hypothetical protein